MISSSKENDDKGKADKGKTVKSSSSTSSPWPKLKDPRIVRVNRAYGGKDRHSKVSTVRGLRDRRVRLSVPTAIQLYDLQEKLGFNQPSKVVDWLLNEAKHEIDQLPPLQFPPGNLGQNCYHGSLDWNQDQLGFQQWNIGTNLRGKDDDDHKDDDNRKEGYAGSSSNHSNFQGLIGNVPQEWNPSSNFSSHGFISQVEDLDHHNINFLSNSQTLYSISQIQPPITRPFHLWMNMDQSNNGEDHLSGKP